jgi:hypothetical protein
MARFLFLILLVANFAFAAHIYLDHTKPSQATPIETNRDAIQVDLITDPVKAQSDAFAAKKLVETLMGATCLQLGVKPNDAARAQSILATLNLSNQLTQKNTEEFTRFAVALPIQASRKVADSLGLFSTEEAAKRIVSELQTKASIQVKGISITAKNPVAKETLFQILSPDAALINRLAVMQRDFESSTLSGIDCPAANNAPTSGATANAAKNTSAVKGN